jgi:molybdopterin converting factor subunit 1
MQAQVRTITVRVLLFAAYRETMGERELELEAPPDCTLADLYGLLEERRPAMSKLRGYTTFAVNREVVPPRTVLRDGDEVALLQPVSGGCRA